MEISIFQSVGEMLKIFFSCCFTSTSWEENVCTRYQISCLFRLSVQSQHNINASVRVSQVQKVTQSWFQEKENRKKYSIKSMS